MRYFHGPLATALALLATAAAAQPYTPLETIPGPPPESAMPAPGQSKGEVLAAKQFGWLDADRDGFLSRDEVALFPRLRDAFDQADQNRDNRVSLDEIRALALQRRAEKAAPPPAAVEPAAPAPRAVPPKAW